MVHRASVSMILSWIFISCFLQNAFLVCSWTFIDCLHRTGYHLYHEGNVVIAGFFPTYTMIPKKKTVDWRTGQYSSDLEVKLHLNTYQSVLAMRFAIEEVNSNPHLLPNTSLGFEAHDMPLGERRAVDNLFHCFSGKMNAIPNYSCAKESKSAAVLTGTPWTVSEQLATLLDIYKFPQLSFGPFDSILSDQGRFPSLYQVADKDTSLASAVASLMLHFQWTWVGLFITDDDKSTQILSDLRREMDRNGVCAAFLEMISIIRGTHLSNYWNKHMQVLESSANVIVVYGDTDSHSVFLQNIYGKTLVWKVWVLNSQSAVFGYDDYFLLDSLHGALVFSHHHGQIVNFTNFMQAASPSKYPDDIFLHLWWTLFFNCSVSKKDCKIVENCLPNGSLGILHVNPEKEISEETHNVYNAVYAVAHSLHEMILNQVESQPSGKGKETVFFPWQLHSFLKNAQLTNPAGDPVVLGQKRKPEAEYDILNFWNFPNGLELFVKVGTFSPNALQGQQLSLSDNTIEWATGFTEIPRSVCSESCLPGFRKTSQEGKAACCFDCTPCPENEISNETNTDQCVKCPESHYANTKRNHCLQKTVTFLSYSDLLGKALMFMSLGFSSLTTVVLMIFLRHRDTPIVKANNRSLSYILLITLTFCFLCPLIYIGRPNTATCVLQQNTFGLLFTVALSTVLAKTLTVVMAFRATALGSMMRWLMVSRASNKIIPLCTMIQLLLSGMWLANSPPFLDTDAHSEHGHIIIVCNKGSALAFHCVLGYLGLLALGSYTMAFLSRNLPDTFNEAKFLAFSMLVFCSVWLTFLPVYHSSKGKVMVALEVFSILASSAGLLGLIFAPKCYIILVRPDLNSVDHIRGKTDSRRKKKPS